MPLLIGGATTSQVHTAVKISPNYSAQSGHLRHRREPRRGRGVEPAFGDGRDAYVARIRDEYVRSASRARAGPRRQGRAYRSPTPAPTSSASTGPAIRRPRPAFLGTRALFRDYDLATLARYIDWTPFFAAWEMKGTFPRILDDDQYGAVGPPAFRGRAGHAAPDHREKNG